MVIHAASRINLVCRDRKPDIGESALHALDFDLQPLQKIAFEPLSIHLRRKLYRDLIAPDQLMHEHIPHPWLSRVICQCTDLVQVAIHRHKGEVERRLLRPQPFLAVPQCPQGSLQIV